MLKTTGNERRLFQEKIRREGNYIHNVKAMKNNTGEIMPQIRPAHHEDNKVESFLPCIYCKGFFKKKILWVHHKRCLMNLAKNDNKHKIMPAKLMLTGDISEGNRQLPPNFVKDIIHGMTEDDITDVALKDPVIINLGKSLYLKTKRKNATNYVRQKMRETARLLIEATEIDSEITDIETLIMPINFDIIINAAHKLCKYDDKTGLFGLGVLPLKTSHNLKKCGALLQVQALKNSDHIKVQQTDYFLKLMETEYSVLCTEALQTLKERKFNKPKYLPLSKDVKSLTEYVNAELQIAYDCLISNEDTVSYTKLSKVLMVSLILFNRRRSGEVQKISLKNVEDGLKTNLSMDMFKLEDLGYIEKFLLKSLKRIEIMGKKGRGVPILLKTVHTNAIELLIEKREVMDIPEENPYLFARCSENAKTPHSACLELSKMARLAKLEHPEYMKSTLLRKHIATISQIVSLSDVELKQLATFMGHDLTVHMDYYRLPVDILQITKVEKLLIASEQNTIKHGKPVCIDSINIDDEDHIFDDAIADDNITPPTPSPNVVVPPRKKRTHKAWQPHEKEAVAKYFKTHIEQKKLPFKHEVKQFLFENPTVTRTWDKIKFWIKNKFSK